MIHTPKISFETSLGGEVFAAPQGAVELSAGMTPNTLTLRTPKHEYAKIAPPDWSQPVTLRLYWSDPDAPDVTLSGWFIDSTRDVLVGRQPGDSADSVQLMDIRLIDRRFELLDGYGGAVWLGRVNQTAADGVGVENLWASDPDADVLLSYLLNRLQYASGLAAIEGEIPAAFAAYQPRNLDWGGANIPGEIAQLLDYCRAAWLLKADGTYGIEFFGAGTDPTLPTEDLIPALESRGWSYAPQTVVVTSAPQPAVMQEVIYGPQAPSEGQLRWRFVGYETDKSLQPLESLSYLGGKTPAQLVQEDFASLAGNPAALELARASFFCLLRLEGGLRKNFLPILTQTTETVTDGDETERPLPVLIEALCSQKQGEVWNNSAAWLAIAGAEIDPVNGLIQLPQRLGRVAANGAADPISTFTALADNQLRVSFAHAQCEHYGGAAPWTDYYCKAWTRSGSQIVEAGSLDAVLHPAASRVKVIHAPHLVEFRHRTSGWNFESDNASQLHSLAQPIAAAALLPGGFSGQKTYRYRGLHAIELTGKISAVRWDVLNGITEFDYLFYTRPQGEYQQAQAARSTAQAARSSAAQADALTGQLKRGGGEVATPKAEMPGQAAPADPPRRFMARLTSATLNAAGEYRWNYGFVQAKLTADSYNGWADVSGGITGTARNFGEKLNTASATVYSNGVLKSDLTTDFNGVLKPFPADSIVEIVALRYDNGSGSSGVSYWFGWPSGVGGGCVT